MFAIGTKRHRDLHLHMSAFGGKADIGRQPMHFSVASRGLQTSLQWFAIAFEPSADVG